MKLPLEGIRVVDFGNYFSVPSMGPYLTDFGAEVIKCEWRQGHDDRRVLSSQWLQNEGWNHQVFNRGKKSIIVDLKKSKGIQMIHDLVKVSDVFLHNWRNAEIPKDVQMDYERLREINPGLIYVSQTGWGEKGPYKDKLGYDIFMQGFTGMAVKLKNVGPPFYAPAVMSGFTSADLQIGMYCVSGILMALMQREKTGKGQYISASLLGGEITLIAERMCRVKDDPHPEVYEGPLDPVTFPTWFVPFPPINPMYHAYKTASDEGIAVAVFNDDHWAKLCSLMELDDLASNTAYDTHEKREGAGEELHNILQSRFSERTGEAWLWRLNEVGIPATLVYNRQRPVFKNNDFYFEDPQSKEMSYTERWVDPDIGPIDAYSVSTKLSKIPAKAQGHAPFIGEHTDYVLSDILQYSQEQIDDLKKDDVITWNGFLPHAGRKGVGIHTGTRGTYKKSE